MSSEGEEPQIKKPRKNHFENKQECKQNKYLQPGQLGFLVTCNFQEKKCVRECYNILNHYADELYGPLEKKEIDGNNDSENNEFEDDIFDDLEKEIKNVKSIKYRFQLVDTGAHNCLFIKTTLSNPIELGLAIVKDIAETKKQRSRHIFRLVPISAVTKANLSDIINSAGKLFDENFLNEPKTFSIIFNKRFNNVIKRDVVIKELADLVVSKNIKNKVDLKNAEVSVIVEIIKGLCCLSVVPNYLKYKKFNLIELTAKTDTINDLLEKSITPEETSKLKEDNAQSGELPIDITKSEDKLIHDTNENLQKDSIIIEDNSENIVATPE